ncbi:hypothetical protein H0H92_008493 [Tricholoma furcatifolium]|nr:hypothetical protein H0H92_008493 [Tricholoma furcatifolium]
MAANVQPAAPAWQTDELQDEWVELDDDNGDGDIDDDLTYGTRSISLTAPLASHIYTSGDGDGGTSSSQPYLAPGGTFLVREDIPHDPLLAKTPGRQKKGVIKDFFSPLHLERMFEPPSPPSSKLSNTHVGPSNPFQPSRLTPLNEAPSAEEDEIIETDMPDMNSFHGRKASIACKFTFAMPRERLVTPNPAGDGTFPQAQSTPNPPFPSKKITPPTTDPRLRLFQFQYDTYTREQLSAMVDSIAINSGTGTTQSPTSFPNLSRVSEADGTVESMSHFRSAKRVKLSPQSDYEDGAGNGVTIARPILPVKDYVGESKSLMQQIKQARDFSTISTVPSVRNTSKQEETPEPDPQGHIRRTSFLKVPTSSAETSASGSYTPSNYRQQAAALMAQIKNDMKGQKRVFSGDTETSYFTSNDEEKSVSPHVGRMNSVRVVLPDGKENHREANHRRTPSNRSAKSNSSSKHKPSPKRGHRAQPQPDADALAEEVFRLSLQDRRSFSDGSLHSSQPSSARRTSSSRTVSLSSRPPSTPSTAPSSLVPPAYPLSSVRNDDLNRFVSSSTASGGTTLTAGSVPSFVKHAGPAHIRTIAPTDMPPVPEVYKGMYFDKVMMKWVKNTAKATQTQDQSHVTEELSEDPFGDIESLKDESRVGREEAEAEVEAEGEGDVSHLQDHHQHEMSRIEEEQSEMEDEEEMELNSFSTDDPSAHIVEVMTGVDTYDDGATTDSDDEADPGVAAFNFNFAYDDLLHRDHEHESFLSMSSPASMDPPDLPPPREHEPIATAGAVTATPLRPTTTVTVTTTTMTMTPGPAIRSALKSNTATTAGTTPVSAMKSRYQTPLHRSHRRSVSFSDGKREGPIQGLLGDSTGATTDGEPEGYEMSSQEAVLGVGSRESASASASASGIVQSARSKRIAQMMEALEAEDDDDFNGVSMSPTNAGAHRWAQAEAQAHAQAQAVTASQGPAEGSSRRVFSRSRTHKPDTTTNADTSLVGTGAYGNANANATFLTECSFGVAHERLVEVITDVEPFTPHWDELGAIDLSGKKLESVARLKEFLPRLDALSLNSNQLAWLSGIPGSVRTLAVASNVLTGLTSYSHLLNLESLDISQNEVESLKQLACLRHLRELKADGNKISSIEGLERMDGLVKLSLQGNSIRTLELNQCRWTRLEMLNLSQNRLDRILGLSSLQALVAFNVDNNELGELQVDGAMPKMRILRASGNRLHQLRVGNLFNLRTLYADNNCLTSLVKVERLTKLENLSVRNQSGRGLNLLTRDVRDVKRLYLSGNPLKAGFLNEPCYNLHYLEVAACRLTALPEDMGRMVPNLRALNLNYNFLEDVSGLSGLGRLRKLSIIGSRLKSTKGLIRLLQGMPELEMVDFR